MCAPLPVALLASKPFESLKEIVNLAISPDVYLALSNEADATAASSAHVKSTAAEVTIVQLANVS